VPFGSATVTTPERVGWTFAAATCARLADPVFDTSVTQAASVVVSVTPAFWQIVVAAASWSAVMVTGAAGNVVSVNVAVVCPGA
jgi:hypothetical protein